MEEIKLIFSLILPVISNFHINSILYSFSNDTISITVQFPIVMNDGEKIKSKKEFKN